MSKADALCEPLHEVMRSGTQVGRSALINELSFYRATFKIKQMVGHVMRGESTTTPRPPIYELMDAIESFVGDNHPRFFGRVWVKRQHLEEQLGLVEAGLRKNGAQSTAAKPLREVMEAGKPLWGGRLAIDEEQFFTATTRIKKDFNPTSPQLRPHTPEEISLAVAIDELEKLVEGGTTRLLGKVSVNRQEYERRVEEIAISLHVMEELLPTSQNAN